MSKPTVIGPSYSTYTRSIRLALEEKSVDYALEEVDFIGSGWPEGYAQKQPFMKVPAFEHDGFALYETGAVLRYVDAAFDGPALTPGDLHERARMDQVLSIVDSYTYGPSVGAVFIQRAVVPMQGGQSDEAAIAAAMPAVRLAVSVLDGFLDGRDYLASASISLADLHLVPVLQYLAMTPEGKSVLADNPRLSRWLSRMGERDSVTRTAPSLG